jgi:hypothetical protein
MNRLYEDIDGLLAEAAKWKKMGIDLPSVGDKLKQYIKDGDKYLTFVALDKVGINPMSGYETPIGLYAYQMTSWFEKAWDNTYMPGRRGGIPFATEQPYIGIVQRKVGYHNGLVVIDDKAQSMRYGMTELERDIEALSKLTGVTYEDLWEWGNMSRLFTPFGRFWNASRMLAGVLTAGRHRNVRVDGEVVKGSTAPVKWNALMRHVGILAVQDNGSGLIHPMEPHQTVFLSQAAWKEVERFENPLLKRKTLMQDARHVAKQMQEAARNALKAVDEMESSAKSPVAMGIMRHEEAVSMFTIALPIDGKLVSRYPKVHVIELAKHIASTGELLPVFKPDEVRQAGDVYLVALMGDVTNAMLDLKSYCDTIMDVSMRSGSVLQFLRERCSVPSSVKQGSSELDGSDNYIARYPYDDMIMERFISVAGVISLNAFDVMALCTDVDEQGFTFSGELDTLVCKELVVNQDMERLAAWSAAEKFKVKSIRARGMRVDLDSTSLKSKLGSARPSEPELDQYIGSLMLEVDRLIKVRVSMDNEVNVYIDGEYVYEWPSRAGFSKYKKFLF